MSTPRSKESYDKIANFNSLGWTYSEGPEGKALTGPMIPVGQGAPQGSSGAASPISVAKPQEGWTDPIPMTNPVPFMVRQTAVGCQRQVSALVVVTDQVRGGCGSGVAEEHDSPTGRPGRDCHKRRVIDVRNAARGRLPFQHSRKGDTGSRRNVRQELVCGEVDDVEPRTTRSRVDVDQHRRDVVIPPTGSRRSETSRSPCHTGHSCQFPFPVTVSRRPKPPTCTIRGRPASNAATRCSRTATRRSSNRHCGRHNLPVTRCSPAERRTSGSGRNRRDNPR
jgi:hypothetical protein